MRTTHRAAWLKALFAGAYGAAVLPYLHGLSVGSYERYLVVNYLLLLFVPLLILFFLFAESPADYGFSKGDARSGRRLFVLLFVPSFVAYVIASRLPAFQSYYPVYSPARYSAGELLFWETAFNGFYMFCWEFFFRGFLLFGLLPALGNGAIAVQAIVFGAMHWGKPMPEFYVSFLTGVVLGLVALRTRSFLPTFALHAASAISFDLLVLAWGGRLGHLLF